MDMALDTIVPESLPWEHTDEGPEYVSILTFYLIERNVSSSLYSAILYPT